MTLPTVFDDEDQKYKKCSAADCMCHGWLESTKSFEKVSHPTSRTENMFTTGGGHRSGHVVNEESEENCFFRLDHIHTKRNTSSQFLVIGCRFSVCHQRMDEHCRQEPKTSRRSCSVNFLCAAYLETRMLDQVCCNIAGGNGLVLLSQRSWLLRFRDREWELKGQEGEGCMCSCIVT